MKKATREYLLGQNVYDTVEQVKMLKGANLLFIHSKKYCYPAIRAFSLCGIHLQPEKLTHVYSEMLTEQLFFSKDLLI